jgi:hypothetical protein
MDYSSSHGEFLDIYQGASGIALFLAELGAAAGTAFTRRTAEAGLRHALRRLDSDAHAGVGLYAGWPGFVFAAARCAHLWNSDEHATAARRVFARLGTQELAGWSTDLVSGAAGGILALLCAGDYVELPGVDELLSTLGERLVVDALRRPRGWSWRTTSHSVADDLVGYAHGTAGISHALRELAVATGNGKYAFAADEAIRYEGNYFDRKAGTWHDLRYDDEATPPLASVHGEAVCIGRPERPPRIPSLPYTWCHGATGIGLSRLRALDSTYDASLLEDVRSASASTVRWDETHDANYCLCHGHLGNAEFLMEASSVLAEPALRQQAEARAMQGREQFELRDRAWPTIRLVRRNPSLMTGEAGVGYFYLRMADSAVPSLLALKPKARRHSYTERGEYANLRDQNLEGMFGDSLDLFTAHPAARARILSSIYESARTLPLHDATMRVLNDVRRWRGETSSPDAQTRALRRDYARAELLDLPSDTSGQNDLSDVHLTPTDVPWRSLRVLLAPSVRLVDAPLMPADRTGIASAHELLVRKNRLVQSVPLSPLSALALGACAGQPTTLDEIMRVLAESTTVTEAARPHLLEAVQSLLLSAWRAEILLLWREA